MDRLIVHPSSTAQWQALVQEATEKCHCTLEEEIESYLVFLLMRFTDSPHIVKSIIALDYLNSSHQSGQVRQESLKKIGDICLLFSGLFPEQARKRQVRVSYYVKLGRTAYNALSEHIYVSLSEQFVLLMDILQSMREVDNRSLSLDPLLAEELWHDTGSQHALETLQSFTHHTPLLPSEHNPFSKH